MAKKKATAVEKLKYEEAFEELALVVEQLESGELPLEEALTLFERGQALAQRCSQLLEEAELQLKNLAPEDDELLEMGFDEEPD